MYDNFGFILYYKNCLSGQKNGGCCTNKCATSDWVITLISYTNTDSQVYETETFKDLWCAEI